LVFTFVWVAYTGQCLFHFLLAVDHHHQQHHQKK
jgi:hypothetical protein